MIEVEVADQDDVDRLDLAVGDRGDLPVERPDSFPDGRIGQDPDRRRARCGRSRDRASRSTRSSGRVCPRRYACGGTDASEATASRTRHGSPRLAPAVPSGHGHHDRFRPSLLHRRRRGRPAARQRAAGPADRLRARPAGHRPEGVQRAARAQAPDRLPRRRDDRGNGPGDARRGLPPPAGPASLPGIDGDQGPGVVRGDRPRLRQRAGADLDRGQATGRISSDGCSACPASAR